MKNFYVKFSLLCFIFLTIQTVLMAESFNEKRIKKIIDKSKERNPNAPYLEANMKIANYKGRKISYCTFQLHNLELNPKQKYLLLSRDIRGKTVKIVDVYVDQNLNLVLKTPDKQYLPFEGYKLIFNGYSLGEPMDVILATRDLKSGASVHIVVKPIEAKFESGPKISLELLSPDGSFFLCQGEGFSANEELQYCSISEDEMHQSKRQVDKNGTFLFVICPEVIGKTDGNAEVKFTRSNGESLSLPYVWGKNKVMETSDEDLSALFN